MLVKVIHNKCKSEIDWNEENKRVIKQTSQIYEECLQKANAFEDKQQYLLAIMQLHMAKRFTTDRGEREGINKYIERLRSEALLQHNSVLPKPN